MKRRKKGCLIFVMIFLIAAAIFGSFQAPNRKLEISKETTYYTEPLLADGRVDYITAQNRRSRVGVTNENNALIPLLEVIDIGGAPPPNYLDALIRELGLGKVAIKHKLVGYEKLLADLFPLDPSNEAGVQERENELEFVDAPWRKADHPQIAEVLRQQSPALDIVVESTRRPRLFIPGVDLAKSDDERVLAQASPPITVELRAAAENLAFRAMSRVSNLERLESSARILFLDVVAHFSIYGFDSVGSDVIKGYGYDSSFLVAFVALAKSAGPNEALREINRYFDKTTRAFESKDHRQRLAKAGELEKSQQEMERQLTKFGSVTGSLIKGPVARGRMLGQLSIMIFSQGLFRLSAIDAQIEMTDSLIHLAISIELFKRNSGHYPDSLADLQPDYVSEIPQDWYSTGAVTYHRTESGFVVYSIGENQIDEGGFDNDEGPVAGRDDIRIRIGELEK